MRVKRDAARFYRELVDRYASRHHVTEYDLHDVLHWAQRKGELDLSPMDLIDYHLARASEALRSDEVVNGTGQRVRVRYSVTTRMNGEDGDEPQQQTLWPHRDSASDRFLVESLRQRFEGCRKDIRKLRADVDDLNERRTAQGKRPIQMDWTDLLDEAVPV